MGSNPYELAAAGDWDAVKQAYRGQGVSPATATGFTREIREFYTLGPNCLWITFARDHLWWAFSEPSVTVVTGEAGTEPRAIRPVLGRWRKDDIRGLPLRNHDLSSRLTQLAAYRGTICNVSATDYLVRRINGQEEPIVAAARIARDGLSKAVEALIRHLHWADFELFVDLLFARAGWRRVSALGGRMKDLDLVIEQPLTGERASVQVKSTADQRVLDACVSTFANSASANHFFFVCHSSPGPLVAPALANGTVHIWNVEELAVQAVDQGLTGWLMEKAG
ncbi:restriction endonuclease [Parafrankia sp. BMG5.11]|uniref:restriction endonuclease n=1 Tax=Parafrankia sp. BMG5.11 TaxID=222540 RepID=UPI00140539F0|nr:restriction endonuclease [Parafrankia sp. BMG5.11]